MVLLLGLILGPVLLGVLLAMAKPIIELLHSDSLIGSTKIWGVFLLLHVMWSGLQKKAISGNEGYRYLVSTPISPSIRLRVELSFFATLGSVILIPFLIAICFIWSEKTIIHAIIDSISIVLWVLSLLMIQMLVVQKNKFTWILCLSSFIPPLSVVWFKTEIIFIALSLILIFVAYQQWTIGKVSGSIRLALPSILRFKLQSTIALNVYKLTFRKIFTQSMLIQYLLFFAVTWSALVVLGWFAKQTGKWEIVSIEVSSLQLMNLMSSCYIAVILLYSGMIRASFVVRYTDTERFWLIQGLAKRQLVISELVILFGIAIFAAIPTLGWIVSVNDYLHGLFILLFILLAQPVIYLIYTKPEDVHGVVPVVLGFIWFFICFGLLTI